MYDDVDAWKTSSECVEKSVWKFPGSDDDDVDVYTN